MARVTTIILRLMILCFLAANVSAAAAKCSAKKACKVLNGTCISKEQECDGQEVKDKVFCKGKGCKCCFPSIETPCPTNPPPATDPPPPAPPTSPNGSQYGKFASLRGKDVCYTIGQVPCSTFPDSGNYPHPTQCNKFIKCVDGSVVTKTCSSGKLYNHVTGYCDESMNSDDCLCPLKDCTDKNENCQHWANIEECHKNPLWMLPNCPKACGQCGPPPVTVANLKPIIGVLAQELSNGMKKILPQYNSYIAASYVKFIESGGARVVPILINQDDEYYENMVKSLNAIVFPGGSASITSSSGYGRAGRKLYDLILASGKNGNPIPLWATCLGFEMLLYLHADGPGKYDVLTKCKASSISIPLELKVWKISTLLGSAPDSVMHPLTTMNITSNFHKYCVTPKTFEKYNLDDDYLTVSTNYDTEGLEFISTVEHKTLPIWGTQWHIEKNLFEWKYSSIPHFPEAIHLGHYFAQFFNDYARQNGNSFSSKKEERSHLIYNYNPIYLTPYSDSHDYYSSFHQAYFFE